MSSGSDTYPYHAMGNKEMHRGLAVGQYVDINRIGIAVVLKSQRSKASWVLGLNALKLFIQAVASGWTSLWCGLIRRGHFQFSKVFGM